VSDTTDQMPYREFAEHAVATDNARSSEDSNRASTLFAMDLARFVTANTGVSAGAGRVSVSGLRFVALHNTDGHGVAVALCESDGGRWLLLRISDDDARELADALLRAADGADGEDGAP
jgi:hypothetical protein